jgi:hypothetical protein
MMRLLAIGIVMCAAGCAGGGGGENTMPVSDEEFRAAAGAAVEAVLVTWGDLPGDLTGARARKPSEQPWFELGGLCAGSSVGIDSADDGFGAVVAASGDEFTHGVGDGIGSSAAAFRTLEDAQRAAVLLSAFFRTCRHEYERGLTEQLTLLHAAEGRNISDVSITVAETLAPGGLDWSFGVRRRVSFVTQGVLWQCHVESVFARSGRLIGAIDYTYRGEPEPLRNRVVLAVMQRLEEEDARLPR